MAKPSIRERAAQMICPECGGPVERKSKHGPTPIFCSPEHRKAYSNRLMINGAAVMAYVSAWRIDRGSGEIAQKSLERLCQIVDSFNDDDRNEKRPRADLYAAKLLASPLPTIVESRYGRRKVAQAKALESAKENDNV